MGTFASATCFAKDDELHPRAGQVPAMAARGSSDSKSDRVEGRMPELQDWSWQMRKRASADRRNRKGPHLSLVAGSKTPGTRPVALEPGVQAHIGSLLRGLYDSALREPVPDRFLDLLREIDARTEAATDG